MTNKKKVLLTILIIIVVLCGGVVVGYFYYPIGYADDEVIGNLSLMEMKSVYKYSYADFTKIKKSAFQYVSLIHTLKDLERCKNLESIELGIHPWYHEDEPYLQQRFKNSVNESDDNNVVFDKEYEKKNKGVFADKDKKISNFKKEFERLLDQNKNIHIVKLEYHFIEKSLYEDLNYLTSYEKQISELWLVSFYKLDLEAIKKFNNLNKLAIIDAQFSEKEAEELIEQLSTKKSLKELYLFGDSFKNTKNIGKLNQLDSLEIAYTDVVKDKEKIAELKKSLPSTEITVRNIDGSLLKQKN